MKVVLPSRYQYLPRNSLKEGERIAEVFQEMTKCGFITPKASTPEPRRRLNILIRPTSRDRMKILADSAKHDL